MSVVETVEVMVLSGLPSLSSSVHLVWVTFVSSIATEKNVSGSLVIFHDVHE